MKTVQITVAFSVKVPNNTNIEHLCINVDRKDVMILNGIIPLDSAKIDEFETIMVDEI